MYNLNIPLSEKIGKDQVDDYRKRGGISLKESEKWLRPILNYEESE